MKKWFYLSFSGAGTWLGGVVIQAESFELAHQYLVEQGIVSMEVLGCEIPSEYIVDLEPYEGRFLNWIDLMKLLPLSLINRARLPETDCARHCPNYQDEQDSCNGDCDLEMNCPRIIGRVQ